MLSHLKFIASACSIQHFKKSPSVLQLPSAIITSVKCFSVSPKNSGRAYWSQFRKPHRLPRLPIPGYLIDGKKLRNQLKSGRDPETGRVVIRHKGGGHPKNYRIIDFVRVPLPEPDEKPMTITERVLQIGYDPCRSGRIALVAGNGSNRFKLILAPHGLAAGDIITASRAPPEFVSKLKTGDAYPIGDLPLGTSVHNIEYEPGQGGRFARAAGMSADIIRKFDGNVTFKTRCGFEKTVDARCLATIGRVSNIDHNTDIIGKAGRSRWLNRRPKGKTGKARWLNKKKRM